MIRASQVDKKHIVKILTIAFYNDPHVNWLLSKCKKGNKLEFVMNYVVDEMMERGEIYLSDCGNGVAIWKSHVKEKLSMKYILRNIKAFLYFDMYTVFRVMKSEYSITKKYPSSKNYLHLYQIAVLPEARGRGVASTLIRERITLSGNACDIYLETANSKNVSIYNTLGFYVYDEIAQENITLWLMKYQR